MGRLLLEAMSGQLGWPLGPEVMLVVIPPSPAPGVALQVSHHTAFAHRRWHWWAAPGWGPPAKVLAEPECP